MNICRPENDLKSFSSIKVAFDSATPRKTDIEPNNCNTIGGL